MATEAQTQHASVSLHPLASRDGQQSSTIVSVQIPQPQAHEVPSAATDELPCLQDLQASLDDTSPWDLRQQMPASVTPKPWDRKGSVDATWGLEHEDIDQYPVMDDRRSLCTLLDEEGYPHVFPVDDAPPIRAMSVQQLAELHARYNSLDVPHSVLFPFLHGVDGNNVAQNVFFKAPLTGQPAPNYRGLTIVRADMPTEQQQRKRHSVQSSASSMQGNAHIGDVSTPSSDCGSPDSASSSSDHSDEPGNQSSADHSRTGSMGYPMTASSSSASFASSYQSGGSLFSDSLGHSSATDSRQSCDSSHTSMHPSLTDDHHKGRQESPVEYDPQPDHSLLNSSFYPYEIVRPPLLFERTSKKTYHAAPDASLRPDHSLVHTAAFYRPEQANGVNLRNFKIQAAKYATVSDIVIYCPAGFHDGVLTMARWFREAHETCWLERQERGLGGLRYNVFIVTEDFSAFERSLPHLVAVGSDGFSRNRVDFVEREREEMQRLTAASLIDDNVWLACTADAPLMDGDSDVDSDDEESQGAGSPRASNPHGVSICVECHDAANVPEATELAQASEYLDSVEATTLSELSRHSAREVEKEDICNSNPPHVSLGPNGWTPAMPSRLQVSSLRRKHSGNDTPASSEPALSESENTPQVTLSGNNVVRLECSSLSGLSTGHATGSAPHIESQLARVVEATVSLCIWIKEQTQPAKPVAPTPSRPASPQQQFGQGSGGFFSSAFRNAQQNGRSGSTSPASHHSAGRSPQRQNSQTLAPATHSAAPKRHPRPVMIHCGDGYTESAIIALTYLMYSRGLSLPEAYLDLQNRASRSFFVFAKDLPLLKLLEKGVFAVRRREAEQAEAAAEAAALASASHNAQQNCGRPKAKHSFPWLSSEEGKRRALSTGSSGNRKEAQNSLASDSAGNHEHSVWARSLHGLVSAASGSSSPLRKTPSNSGIANSATTKTDCANAPSRARTPTPKTPRDDYEERQRQQSGQDHSWFYDGRFEGSFPSRILPFLYLGNLNHALNPAMLRVLGIKHVVSVGETALQPPASASSAVVSSTERDGATGPAAASSLPEVPDGQSSNSLWQEQRAGRISVLDLKNVADDGIDPLRSTMRLAVEYIESARRKGEKVLVHCRVGVSRSTTIVLAYVMAHLDMSLVESYLLVRSRRLSILIQPHLLFFWELRGWETYVASQKLNKAAGRAIQADGQATQGQAASACEHPVSLSQLSLKDKSAVNPSNARQVMEQTTSVGSSLGFGHHKSPSGTVDVSSPLDVDIGVGAGSPYGFSVPNVQDRCFGTGSPSGIHPEALRLTWGYLCREVAALNDRYF
ncbi:unnamed protein product [Jaminaea pallidilutea]